MPSASAACATSGRMPCVTPHRHAFCMRGRQAPCCRDCGKRLHSDMREKEVGDRARRTFWHASRRTPSALSARSTRSSAARSLSAGLHAPAGRPEQRQVRGVGGQVAGPQGSHGLSQSPHLARRPPASAAPAPPPGHHRCPRHCTPRRAPGPRQRAPRGRGLAAARAARRAAAAGPPARLRCPARRTAVAHDARSQHAPTAAWRAGPRSGSVPLVPLHARKANAHSPGTRSKAGWQRPGTTSTRGSAGRCAALPPACCGAGASGRDATMARTSTRQAASFASGDSPVACAPGQAGRRQRLTQLSNCSLLLRCGDCSHHGQGWRVAAEHGPLPAATAPASAP